MNSDSSASPYEGEREVYRERGWMGMRKKGRDGERDYRLFVEENCHIMLTLRTQGKTSARNGMNLSPNAIGR